MSIQTASRRAYESNEEASDRPRTLEYLTVGNSDADADDGEVATSEGGDLTGVAFPHRIELFQRLRQGLATAQELLPEGILRLKLQSPSPGSLPPAPSPAINRTNTRRPNMARACPSASDRADPPIAAFPTASNPPVSMSSEADSTAESMSLGLAMTHAPPGLLHAFVKHIRPFSVCFDNDSAASAPPTLERRASESAGGSKSSRRASPPSYVDDEEYDNNETSKGNALTAQGYLSNGDAVSRQDDNEGHLGGEVAFLSHEDAKKDAYGRRMIDALGKGSEGYEFTPEVAIAVGGERNTTSRVRLEEAQRGPRSFPSARISSHSGTSYEVQRKADSGLHSSDRRDDNEGGTSRDDGGSVRDALRQVAPEARGFKSLRRGGTNRQGKRKLAEASPSLALSPRGPDAGSWLEEEKAPPKVVREGKDLVETKLPRSVQHSRAKDTGSAGRHRKRAANAFRGVEGSLTSALSWKAAKHLRECMEAHAGRTVSLLYECLSLQIQHRKCL